MTVRVILRVAAQPDRVCSTSDGVAAVPMSVRPVPILLQMYQLDH
jgi:hypothetical protein